MAFAGPASADFDLARVVAAVARAGKRLDALPPTLLGRTSERVSVLVERHDASAPLPDGTVPIPGPWFALELERRSLAASATWPGLTLHWAPARRLLVERALEWSRVPAFRAATRSAGGGRGVVVGVVDTGIDTAHADFRDENGATRVRWLIDFTRPPAGHQPELETEFGCSANASCAIYSGADIDRLLTNDVFGDEPRDTLGHGTHVTSLAAGNGNSDDSRRFAGVAPEADLVIARVSGGELGIFDDLVMRGVRFIFDRADALDEPAVVNLSLGSDLGAHDGSSALERALSEFVGPDQPGRSIVVAAGNSAGMLRNGHPPYPSPQGIHTEVHVPRESPTWVPILTPFQGTALTDAELKIWISTRPGDALQVGLERRGKLVGEMTRPNSFSTSVDDSLRVVILNGLGSSFGDRVPSDACLVSIDGVWPAGETFALRFGGHGTASLWLSGAGDLDPVVSPIGALFPQSQKEGTINVPASAPELIAVGATMNRTSWTDWEGKTVSHPENGAADSPADSIAYYSAAGPNARGVLKPDIVAPGTNLIGAMSGPTDPRFDGKNSLFSGKGFCGGDRECLVIDDFHAVSSGTSMASPIVAGAIALLFERDPSLTQNQLRALLQAGARPLTGSVPIPQQSGVGALDLEASLIAAIAADSPLTALPTTQSWLSLANAYAHPDPDWPLEGYAELRDDAGKLADAIDPRELGLAVEGGRVAQPLTRIAPALYRFAVVAPAGSGGGTLRLTLSFREQTLAEKSVPIGVDPGVANGVPEPRGGGCALVKRRHGQTRSGEMAGAAISSMLGGLLLRRRRRRAHEQIATSAAARRS